MYGELEWKEVRELFGAGNSKSVIARRLGMSRTTVARLLALSAPPDRKAERATIRTATASGGRPRRQEITVLPPIMRPASPEQSERIVRALSALLLAHLEREASVVGSTADQKPGGRGPIPVGEVTSVPAAPSS